MRTFILISLGWTAFTLFGEAQTGGTAPRDLAFETGILLGDSGDFASLEDSHFLLKSDAPLRLQDVKPQGTPDYGTYYASLGFENTGFSIQHTRGLPFTMLEIDLAEYSRYFSAPREIGFTGYRLDGSTVHQSFLLDGKFGSKAPSHDWQYFQFNAEFHGLREVVADTTLFGVDNIGVQVESGDEDPTDFAKPQLYDVTWGFPQHQLDEVTEIGGAIAPSSIASGSPTVRAQIGTLGGPALELTGVGSPGIKFDLANDAQLYRLEFDAYFGPDAGLIVFFDDAHAIHRFDFFSDGKILAFRNHLPAATPAGAFPVKQTVHVAISVSRVTAEWEILVDGTPQFRGPLDSVDFDMSDLRLLQKGRSTSVIGLDNVRIFADGTLSKTAPGSNLALGFIPFFPPVKPGQTQPATLVLVNSGSDPVTVQSVVSTNPQFAITNRFPVTIPAGSSADIASTFTPLQTGPVYANLLVATDSSSDLALTVPIIGHGKSVAHLEPPPTIGVAVLKGARVSVPLPLTNSGTASMQYFMQFSGDADLPSQWLSTKIDNGYILPHETLTPLLQIQAGSRGPGLFEQTITLSAGGGSEQVPPLPAALKVLPPNSFTRWQMRHFGSNHQLPLTHEADQWSQTADPDHDGLSNLVEFLNASDPQVAKLRTAPVTKISKGQTVFEFRLQDQHDGAPFQVEADSPVGWHTDGLSITSQISPNLPPGFHLIHVTAKKGATYAATSFRIVPREP